MPVIATAAWLGLAGCGAAASVAVSVVSPAQEPVSRAIVAVASGHIAGTTNQAGIAALRGLRPGVHEITIEARGYFTAQSTVRLRPREPVVIILDYRPAPGTYLWNIGPDGWSWDVGTVTRSTITSKEYDWSCTRNPATGKLTGEWSTFAAALPEAIAPNAVAPEWKRGRFPPGGPPKPPHGCVSPGAKATHAAQAPFYAVIPKAGGVTSAHSVNLNPLRRSG